MSEDVRLSAMLEILYASGLRVTELVSLKLNMFERDATSPYGFKPWVNVIGKGNWEDAVGTKQIFSPVAADDVPEITPENLNGFRGSITLIDVRRPEEFEGELSHIPGARLITLGPDLDDFLSRHDKDDEVVFICQSGARSGRATLQSRALGFSKSVNLQGGMILWIERGYPVKTAKGER